MNSYNSPSHHISDGLLYEFLDQALTKVELDQVKTHIEICPSCGQRFAELSALFSTLEDLPDEKMDRDLAPAVLASIQGKTVLSPIWWWSLLTQGILALGIIAIAASHLGLLDYGSRTLGILLSRFQVSLGEWISFIGVIQPQLERFLEFQLTISLNLPLQPIFWLLLFATLTWIIGNAILLRPQFKRAEQ